MGVELADDGHIALVRLHPHLHGVGPDWICTIWFQKLGLGSGLGLHLWAQVWIRVRVRLRLAYPTAWGQGCKVHAEGMQGTYRGACRVQVSVISLTSIVKGCVSVKLSDRTDEGTWWGG